MAADYLSAIGSLFGGGSSGGGGMYGNSGSSGVSTPVSTQQGGIGSQSFIFGGNPNIQAAKDAVTNPWLIGGAVVVLGLLIWRKYK